MNARRAVLTAVPLLSLAVIAALASGVVGTLSQLTAAIQNPSNAAVSGSVALAEDDTCTASGDGTWQDCGSVDKFGGGTLAAGTSRTTTVRLANTGTAPGELAVLPSQCRDTLTAAHGGLCDQVTIEVRCDGATVVSPRTLNAFHDGRSFPAGYPVGTVAPGTSASCDVIVTAGAIGAAGTVSQPIAWLLAAGS